MSAVDPWRVLAVFLLAGGLLYTGVAGSQVASALDANGHDYTMSLHEKDAPDEPDATVYAYENLSEDARGAFDDLYTGEANSATVVPEERAEYLAAETELVISDRINVRYQGDIYWLWLGERVERATTGQLAIFGAIKMAPPLTLVALGGLLYARRRGD
ncbi:hypothetical protein [Halapricum sp. CBA1109]|uniref:hypothetical protein n=1 Tax=Halapricum sp. CBA1109 TaxID=2668068 RepID=UPI0012F7DA78|nr:hypothetical protein [Halapricum sp. CBA1109]